MLSKTTKAFLIVILLGSANNFFSQNVKSEWSSFQFLIGEWIGEGTGAPGEATGSTNFYLSLGEQVLVRKNNAQYPAANGRPSVNHEDLLFFYKENSLTRAIYFDNEGHTIHYSVAFSDDSNELILTSDVIQSAPRFRFIYQKMGDGKLKTIFEMAPPGKPDEFKKYVVGIIKRKI